MPTPQTPAEMEAAMLNNLPLRYGKSLSEWMKICESAGLKKKMEYVQFLKQKEGVKHGEAFVLTQIYFNGGRPVYSDPEALLQEQYKAPELRDLYDLILSRMISEIPYPIRVGVCKGYTSLIGEKQFAVLIPKRKEIWIGLSLPNEEPNYLLKSSKSLGGSDKINRYISISNESDLDKDAFAFVLKSYKNNR